MVLSHEQKLSLLHSLIRLAGADGEHRDEEYDMLHLVAQQLDVEPMELEALFSTTAEMELPEEETQRILIFFHMLKIVWADGEFEPNEELLLRELGAQMGLRLQAVERVIDRSKLFPDGELPVDELIKIFQVHHN